MTTTPCISGFVHLWGNNNSPKGGDGPCGDDEVCVFGDMERSVGSGCGILVRWNIRFSLMDRRAEGEGWRAFKGRNSPNYSDNPRKCHFLSVSCDSLGIFI